MLEIAKAASDLPAMPDRLACHPTAIAFALTLHGRSHTPEQVSRAIGRPPKHFSFYTQVLESYLFALDKGLRVTVFDTFRADDARDQQLAAQVAHESTDARFKKYAKKGRYIFQTVRTIGAPVVGKALQLDKDAVVIAGERGGAEESHHSVVLFRDGRTFYRFIPRVYRSVLATGTFHQVTRRLQSDDHLAVLYR